VSIPSHHVQVIVGVRPALLRDAIDNQLLRNQLAYIVGHDALEQMYQTLDREQTDDE
jgi:hypothetical protein